MNSFVIETAGNPLPRIASCQALEGKRLDVLWKGGRKDIVDVSAALEARDVFAAVRSSHERFMRCSVSEYGECVSWDDGAELSANWIAELAGNRA